ncbi:MAG: hypothetical protein AAB638_00850 [Patescibacteria group bacterium]
MKTIPMDYHDLDGFLSTLFIYWLGVANRRDINREEFYRCALVKKFYESLRKRHDGMLQEGRKVLKVKFDAVHAVLLVDVLQRVGETKEGNQILFELGSFCPPQMMGA